MGGRGSLSPQSKSHTQTVIDNALAWAKKQKGSGAYGRWVWNGTHYRGTAKCNLFVEHSFNRGNPHDNPFPKTPSRYYKNVGIPHSRNFSAAEIYAGRMPNFKLVKTPQPGDIAADGGHVGIVSGKNTTISASIKTNTVVENDWGFRTGDKSPQRNMRFFRYTGEE